MMTIHADAYGQNKNRSEQVGIKQWPKDRESV
jgi:hypothetical protein